MIASILLVDGVGHPKLIEIEYALVMPIRIDHDIQEKDGTVFPLSFFRQGEEVDQQGRAVYRQETLGARPAIRTRFIKVGTTGE
jgi:hypothetical protein